MAADFGAASAASVKNGDWEVLSSTLSIRCLALAHGSDFLLLGSERGTVECWDISALPLQVQTYPVPAAEGKGIHALEWSHNNQVIFVVGANGSFSAFDVRSGGNIFSLVCVLKYRRLAWRRCTAIFAPTRTRPPSTACLPSLTQSRPTLLTSVAWCSRSALRPLKS